MAVILKSESVVGKYAITEELGRDGLQRPQHRSKR